MKVRAEVITRENVDVEINVNDVFTNILSKLRTESNVPSDAYINNNGEWESWDDLGGRGSGLTTVHRPATATERSLYESIAQVRSYTNA